MCQSLGEGTILNGGHVFLIIFLLTPVYAVWPTPLTILLLQTVALALGAWPVYLLARNLVSPAAGIILSFCYLIYPALNYVNLFEFHIIVFATPLLLFMFFYYIKQKWWLFLLFMTLSLFCREDVAIPVAAIGCFALFDLLRKPKGEKWRSVKWGAVPLAAALIWFILCIKVIQPQFLPSLAKGTEEMKGSIEVFYGWLGGSPGKIFTHPMLGVLRKPKLTYLLQLFLPVGFMPLLSPPALIMVLISLSEGLLSSRFTHFSIRYQYSSIITPLIFISAIYGLRNMLRWKWLVSREKTVLTILLIFAFMSAKSFGPIFKLPEGIKLWQANEEDWVRDKLVREIPLQIPVIATFGFAPKLSMRPQLFYFYHVYSVSRHPEFKVSIPEAQKTSRYAMIDFNDWLTFYDFYTPGGNLDVYKFLYDGNWELIATVNSLALFRKGEKTELGVVSLIGQGSEKSSRPIPGIPQLRFAGFSAAEEKRLGYPVVNLSVDLECRNKTNDDLLLLARFINRSDPSREFQQLFFAPYRIYPTSRWKPGDIVRQKCNLLVPEDIPGGAYDLTLSLIRKRPNLPLSPQAGKLFYNYYDTAMAMKYLPGRWGISPDKLLEQIVIARIPEAVIIEE